MNNERPHEGRNILRRILAHAIGEVAQALEAFGQLLGWRRNMQQLILAFTPIDTNSLFALALQAPCILRFVERPIRHNAVNLADELRSELLTHVPIPSVACTQRGPRPWHARHKPHHCGHPHNKRGRDRNTRPRPRQWRSH